MVIYSETFEAGYKVTAVLIIAFLHRLCSYFLVLKVAFSSHVQMFLSPIIFLLLLLLAKAFLFFCWLSKISQRAINQAILVLIGQAT